MWSDFKPLRRKLGVVILLMACLCAVGWMRSFEFTDALFYDRATAYTHVVSTDRKLVWGHGTFSTDRTPYQKPTISHFHYLTSSKPQYEPENDGWTISFESTWAGFENTVRTRGSERLSIWTIPYYAIVLPLTLLSGCLLLSKPRTSQPKPASES